MVESKENGEMNFDDMMDVNVDYNGIRDRQHSCYTKDLQKDEAEFTKVTTEG